jgi:hypothetical protein
VAKEKASLQNPPDSSFEIPKDSVSVTFDDITGEIIPYTRRMGIDTRKKFSVNPKFMGVRRMEETGLINPVKAPEVPSDHTPVTSDCIPTVSILRGNLLRDIRDYSLKIEGIFNNQSEKQTLLDAIRQILTEIETSVHPELSEWTSEEDSDVRIKIMALRVFLDSHTDNPVSHDRFKAMRSKLLRIDTNVPKINEKVIELSDQFNHYEWYKKQDHEWQTIPLTPTLTEMERKALYSTLIYRLMIRYGGWYNPETKSYCLKTKEPFFVLADQKPLTDYVINYYMQFPPEEVAKVFETNLRQNDLNCWTSEGIDVELRVERTALKRANALRRKMSF